MQKQYSTVVAIIGSLLAIQPVLAQDAEDDSGNTVAQAGTGYAVVCAGIQ